MSTPTALHLTGPTEAGDVEAFLRRIARLDPGTLVRLRGSDHHDGYLTAHARLPVDVLVGRSVRGALAGDADVTTTAGDLLGAAVNTTSTAPGDPAAGSSTSTTVSTTVATAMHPVIWRLAPSLRRDPQWRGTLPPGSGWEPLDTVPVGVIGQVVAGAARAFRGAVPQESSLRERQAVADSLLDQDVLTVSGAGREVVLPLRVLQALRLMGFLGEEDHAGCAVAVRGRWVRLAAPYGTAYRESGPASMASI